MKYKNFFWMGLLSAFLMSCFQKIPLSYHSVDITGSENKGGFENILDQYHQPRTLSEFNNSLVVVFFGYTQCPDVCPTTLLEFENVYTTLKKSGINTQLVFITVDPMRDTPEILQVYLKNFDYPVIGLIPSSTELPKIVKSYRAFYQYSSDPKNTKNYLVDHTAGLYVHDTQGNLRLYTRYPLDTGKLILDLQTLKNSSLPN